MKGESKDEGVIKFLFSRENAPAIFSSRSTELIQLRNALFLRGWIGYDTHHKVGFGNLSLRFKSGFLITCSQTGHLKNLKEDHITFVSSWDIGANQLHCLGPCDASSESLTHAALYELSEEIRCVIHIHHDTKWKELQSRIPCTEESVPYGTPAMAMEIRRLWNDGSLQKTPVLVMAGHEGGIISFGKDSETAYAALESVMQ